jgi:hypothetical protein
VKEPRTSVSSSSVFFHEPTTVTRRSPAVDYVHEQKPHGRARADHVEEYREPYIAVHYLLCTGPSCPTLAIITTGL